MFNPSSMRNEILQPDRTRFIAFTAPISTILQKIILIQIEINQLSSIAQSVINFIEKHAM